MINPHPSKPFSRGQKRHQNILLGILLCVLLSGLGSGTGNVYAQADVGVNLTAQVGFDGFCKESQWIPIHVNVENTGPDLNAEVQVSYKKGSGGKTLTSMNIDLPATSRKEFFLYVYFPQAYSQAWNVSLLARGKVLKKINLAVNCLAAENLILGVLADQPATYDVLNDIQALRGFVRVAQLKTSDLPDREQAWASLDALVVSNVDTGTLTPEQKDALEIWIAKGGKLLIIGGTNWQSTVAGLKDLSPVELTMTSRVNSLSELAAYVKDPTLLDTQTVLASGQVNTDAQVLLQQDGTPLLVQRALGFGTIYFLAADPGVQPLSDWSGMKVLYQYLLGTKSPLPAWADGSWYDYRANQALATIPELGLPSIFYICGLLAFYIGVIGPLNYFILRRAKRREFAWVTIPVLVVIFTCLAYGTGFFYRGTTPTLNRLTVAQAWDGVDQAHIQSLIGIYSPMRTKYDLKAGDRFMFQPFENGDTSLQTSDNWTAYQQGLDMVMPDVPVEIGDMREIVVQGHLPALDIHSDVTIQLSKLNPVLTGTITNKSQFTIKDAILVTSGNWKRLGDLDPGERSEINISLAASANGPAFYSLNSSNILNVTYPALQTDVEATRRLSFLDTVLFTDYGLNNGNWGIYLIGWVDGFGIPAGLKEQRFKTIDTMLYIDRLSPSVKTEPGELRLPTSMFIWEASAPNITPYYASELPAGGYTLRLRPAVPISFRTVKSINLQLSSNASLQDLDVSAWNYELQTWQAIPLNEIRTNIPEPDRYVGPNGEILLKVASNRSDWTQIDSSSISVVVEP